jgi:hypothetical protein
MKCREGFYVGKNIPTVNFITFKGRKFGQAGEGLLSGLVPVISYQIMSNKITKYKHICEINKPLMPW